MKAGLVMLCAGVVALSAATLFLATNDVAGYSYIPLDCKIKNDLGYFSRENPLDPHSEEFADRESLKLLTDCFKNSHPAMFQ